MKRTVNNVKEESHKIKFSYDQVYQSNTHHIVRNRTDMKNYMNDEIFGPVRPENRKFEFLTNSITTNDTLIRPNSKTTILNYNEIASGIK